MDLFKAFKNPSANINSSKFDLSCRRVFSSKAGQCLPSLVFDTVPGDNFRINMSAVMRSETLDTAAFTRGKFNYDFFFVPYQQLWHQFLNFVNQKSDSHSANLSTVRPLYAPTVSLKALCLLLFKGCVGDLPAYYNDLGIPLSQLDIDNSPVTESFKLLNLLGYGQFDELIDAFKTASGDISDTDFLNVLNRLCGNIYVNVFRLLAYQHIWYDIYRNKYYDVPDSNHLMNLWFNADNISGNSLANSRFDVDRDEEQLVNMCMLRYCQWKKDIYTSLMPSQQFGVVSTVDLTGDYSFDISGTSWSAAATYIQASGNAQRGKLYTGTGTFDKLNASVDVLAMRRAEAMQKWKESALRAGNMSPDNQRAHFGVDPYYYEDNEVHFLGSYDGVFQVNPVEATASSNVGSNKSVGDIAATGTSVAGNEHYIDFSCRDYGIIMCICRYVPETEYASTGIEKSNSRFEPFDYYTPEFNSLGLQAVPLIEQENNSLISLLPEKNFTLGFAPRDYDYKQMQDKVYGQFSNYHDFNNQRREFGVFSNWVSPRRDVLVASNSGVVSGRPTSSFYINPDILNSIFLSAVNCSDLTDQFVHQVWFNVNAIRKMPVLGLPEF